MYGKGRLHSPSYLRSVVLRARELAGLICREALEIRRCTARCYPHFIGIARPRGHECHGVVGFKKDAYASRAFRLDQALEDCAPMCAEKLSLDLLHAYGYGRYEGIGVDLAVGG
jgi:hypothetical protein